MRHAPGIWQRGQLLRQEHLKTRLESLRHQLRRLEEREAELADLKPGCLVIDLASKPGGVDFDAAARLGVKAFWALSLPGKVAPVTAGKSIKTTIYNILTELGV